MLFKSVERERERRERLTAGLRLKDITKLSEHNRKGGRISQKQQSPQTIGKPTHRRSQNPVKLQTVSKGLQPQTRSQ